MNWVLLSYHRYFDFSGRSRRMEYWSFQLMWWFVVVAIVGITSALGLAPDVNGKSEPHPVALLILGIWVLANLIPALALTVRRWHDLGQSGWFTMLFGLLSAIPLIGLIPALGNLIWFFMQGTEGENQYGPDPKQAEHDNLGSDRPPASITGGEK